MDDVLIARKSEVATRMYAIADLLADAAEQVRQEAGWIERNVPMAGWDEQCSISYLRSSVLSRQVQDVEPRVKHVARIFDEALADLPAAE